MADGKGIFGEFANQYDQLRPDYPRKMWDTIFAQVAESRCGCKQAAAAGLSNLSVVDVGAGTGRGALFLAQQPSVAHVYVAEPDQGMLDQCKATFSSASPGPGSDSACTASNAQATFLRASAEQLEAIPEGSVDLAVCLQAWHWVDNDAALKQIARILKPGGIFAVAWNDRDLSVPWVAKLERMIEAYNVHYDRDERQCDKYGRPLSTNPDIALLSQQDIPNQLCFDSASKLVDLTHTFSYVRNALTPEQLEAFSAECLQLATEAAKGQGNTTAHHQDDDPPLQLPIKTRLYLLQRQ